MATHWFFLRRVDGWRLRALRSCAGEDRLSVTLFDRVACLSRSARSLCCALFSLLDAERRLSRDLERRRPGIVTVMLRDSQCELFGEEVRHVPG